MDYPAILEHWSMEGGRRWRLWILQWDSLIFIQYGFVSRCTTDPAILRSGLVTPLNGHSVFDALAAESGCGLLDRLIADDYRRASLVTLTLDRKMAALTDAELLNP